MQKFQRVRREFINFIATCMLLRCFGRHGTL